jgi:hypothetical protein
MAYIGQGKAGGRHKHQHQPNLVLVYTRPIRRQSGSTSSIMDFDLTIKQYPPVPDQSGQPDH